MCCCWHGIHTVFVGVWFHGIDTFINSGWELSGQTAAAAKKDDRGKAIAGAVQAAPGWLVQTGS